MPYWTPPTNPYAAAFREPPLPPTVKVETRAASAYEQERIGQRSETSQVIPINRGEFEHTEKGDYRQQTIRVVTASESYDEAVIVTDIGAGSDNLVPVALARVTEDFGVEQVSWAPTSTPVETVPVAGEQASDPLANWYYDISWYQPETAPSYDLSQPDSPYYQPETAAPVYSAPLPVEQAPVDEPQYVAPAPDPYQEYSDWLTQLEQMENEFPQGWTGPLV